MARRLDRVENMLVLFSSNAGPVRRSARMLSRTLALSMAFVLVCRATLAVSAINDADPTCVGDCDDNAQSRSASS